MSPEEIKIKRGVIQELRSLLKKLDSESMDSELNPQDVDAPVEVITPEPDQADAMPMPNPAQLDPNALQALNGKKDEEEAQ